MSSIAGTGCERIIPEEERNKYINGGFRKAAEMAIAKHKEEHDYTVRANKLRKVTVSIDYIVHEAKLHGRSYGREVAVMEGRMQK